MLWKVLQTNPNPNSSPREGWGEGTPSVSNELLTESQSLECRVQCTEYRVKRKMHDSRVCSRHERESLFAFWDGNGKTKRAFPVFETGTGNTRSHSCSLGREWEKQEIIPIVWDGNGKT